MIKRKVKLLLQQRENELKMNLENNYKDLAKAALVTFGQTIEECHKMGDLNDKNYEKYKAILANYEKKMVGYHH